MFVALVITSLYILLVWLVFFRLKLLKFNATWGFVSGLFGVHLLLIFLIGLRFVTPYSTNATVVQHTIQLTPRLPEPTLVTKVYVQPDVPVKKGDKLFEFDRRPYEYKVNAVRAQLAAAEQRVLELKAQLAAATGAVAQARAQRNSAKAAFDAATATTTQARGQGNSAKAALGSAIAATGEAKAKRQLAQDTLLIAQAVHKDDAGAISKLRMEHDRDQLAAADAAVKVALSNQEQARVDFEETAVAAIQIAVANEQKARLAYSAEIDGENTTVALLKANLAEAEYYLEQTVMVSPADGRIMNLQVQPGMVAGIVRYGAIATFIVESDRYLLANLHQENLKWVEPGQPVEVAFDLYPGQIFRGKVQHVWRGSGRGQMVPSGELPLFNPPPRDSSPSRSPWTTPIKRSSRLVPRQPRPFTQAGMTLGAGGRPCGGSASAVVPGRRGCTR
jgi:multidrug resistance efflux pump